MLQIQREKKATHYEKMWKAKQLREAREEDSHGCRSQICEFSHTKKERARPTSSALSQKNGRSPARSYRSLLGGRATDSFMEQPLRIRRTHSSFSLNHNAVQKRQKQFYDEARQTIEAKRKLMDSAQSKRE